MEQRQLDYKVFKFDSVIDQILKERMRHMGFSDAALAGVHL